MTCLHRSERDRIRVGVANAGQAEMKSFVAYAVVGWLSWFIVSAQDQVPLAEQEWNLRANLTSQHYSPRIIPLVTNGEPITFNVSMMLIKICELNAWENSMTVEGWLELMWDDYRLQWDPSQYGGIQDLRMTDREVWQPDLTVYNSVSTENMKLLAETLVVAFSNGTVLRVPPLSLRFQCNVNLSNYPFDEQNCTLIMGSWTYNANQININIQGISLTYLSPSQEWEVLDTTYWKRTQYYPGAGDDPYSDISFSFRLRRKSNDFYITILGPTFVAIIFALIILVEPLWYEKKLLLGLVSFILLYSTVRHLSQKLACDRRETPKLLWYCAINMYLVAAVICFTAISSAFSFRNRKFSLPSWLKKFKNFQQLVNESEQAKVLDDNSTMDEVQTKKSSDIPYCLICLNSVFFIVLIIIFTVFIIWAFV